MPLSTLQSVVQGPGDDIRQGVEFNEYFMKGPVASATADAAPFLLLGTSAALTLEDDEHGGMGKLVSSSTNVAALQANGENFKLASNRKTVFETKIKLADADGMSCFVGLAITDTDPWATSLTDWVGFYTTDGGIHIGCGKNDNNVPGSGTSGETNADSNKDFADDTFVTLRFEVDGVDQVRFYIDGVQVGVISADLPDDEALTPTVAIKGSGETIYLKAFNVFAGL